MKSEQGDADHDRRQLRDGDVAEFLPRVGAVDARGLVEIAGNALQPGEQAHHVERVSRPDVDEGHRMERGLRRREPLDLEVDDVERHQDAVDDALRIEQQPPDDRDDHRREQPRQDVEDAQDAPDRRVDALAVEHQREGQTDQQVEDDAHHGEVEGVAERLPEHRIAEGLLVVVQPDEGGVFLDDRPVQERIAQDRDHRIEHQQGKESRRRGDIGQRHQTHLRLVGKQTPLADFRRPPDRMLLGEAHAAWVFFGMRFLVRPGNALA